MYVSWNKWLTRIKEDYLPAYIRQGGAAVKFVTAEERERQQLVDGFRESAIGENYEFVFIDAALVKVHMPQCIFYEVARQVDWEALTARYLARVLPEEGYRIPPEGEDLLIHRIAELNQRSQETLPGELNGLLDRRIYRDDKMCREFRMAMFRLCQAKLSPETVLTSPASIKDWLTNRLTRITEVKTALIYQRIARHNARHMLASLSHWANRAGKSGLAILIDISRFFTPSPRPRDPGDASVYYSRTAILDAYEVLRECVDAIDEMEHCLMVVVAPSDFLDENNRRGVRSYEALWFRICDEVRDEHMANPLSPLVRLKTEVHQQ